VTTNYDLDPVNPRDQIVFEKQEWIGLPPLWHTWPVSRIAQTSKRQVRLVYRPTSLRSNLIVLQDFTTV
jgi:hypothetical protein